LSVASVEVVDPETGDRFRLRLRHRKDGSEYLQRVPVHVYDLSASTPRHLETLAAFAESASSAYGKRSTGEQPAAADAVRDQFAQRFARVPREESASELLQQRFRSLVGEENLDRLRSLSKQGARVTLVAAKPVALTVRRLPPIEELPIPPPY
jgi:hypothetical protein